MQWACTLTVLACVAVAVIAQDTQPQPGVGGGRRRDKKQKKVMKKSQDCGEWTFEGSECMPKEGTCGLGLKLGKRTGDWCMITEKRFFCKIPCPGEPPLAPGESDLIMKKKGGRKPKRKGRGNVCKYNRKTKECGECDTATNTTTCTLQLKKGPDTCAATKTMTINRCIVPGEGGRKRGRGKGRGGKPCKYMKPAWGDCNPETNTMSRTLTLKKGDDTCEPTKVVTKRCRRSARQAKACKYQKGAWSSCAGDATERTRTLTLKRGNETECEASKTQTKPCKDNCTYGPWTRGECMDGKLTKTRDVLSGEGCKRTTKTKPCGRKG